MTGTVLVVVLITKFTHGAWIAIAAMIVLFVLMQGIHRHYDRVAAELVVDEDEDTVAARRGCTRSCWSPRSTSRRCGRSPTPGPPARRPSRRSRSTSTRRRPRRCRRSGTARDIPVPLKVLDSPYREITHPVIDYVRSDPPRQPARPRHGLHPGVRRRALVGAAAAQPERAAAQGPAAVHARRHGRPACPWQLELVGRPRGPSSTAPGSVRRGAAGGPEAVG